MIDLENEKDFKTKVLEEDICLVDFNAPWCSYCILMEDVLEELSEEVSFPIISVDTDTYPSIASEYKIEFLPTLALFKNGEIVNKASGFMDTNSLKEFISK